MLIINFKITATTPLGGAPSFGESPRNLISIYYPCSLKGPPQLLRHHAIPVPAEAQAAETAREAAHETGVAGGHAAGAAPEAGAAVAAVLAWRRVVLAWRRVILAWRRVVMAVWERWTLE